MIVLLKEKIRRTLNFVFALFYVTDGLFLLYLLRVGGLGVLSSFVENGFLFECARDGAGQGAIVEIGSFKGRTAVSLVFGSRRKGREKIYAIDPQENPEVKAAFLENIRKGRAEDYILPIFKRSEDAAKEFHEPIRLLFIDGCHEYADVKKDILLWKGFLIEGGIIAMHDYLSKNSPAFLEGVQRAVDECIVGNPDFVVEGVIDSILFASWKYTAPENNRIFDRYRRIEKARVDLKAKLDQTLLRY
jgi:predicted O-methyltransferase YrrM